MVMQMGLEAQRVTCCELMEYRHGRQGPTEICTISKSHILTDWLLSGHYLVNLYLLEDGGKTDY